MEMKHALTNSFVNSTKSRKIKMNELVNRDYSNINTMRNNNGKTKTGIQVL